MWIAAWKNPIKFARNQALALHCVLRIPRRWQGSCKAGTCEPLTWERRLPGGGGRPWTRSPSPRGRTPPLRIAWRNQQSSPRRPGKTNIDCQGSDIFMKHQEQEVQQNSKIHCAALTSEGDAVMMCGVKLVPAEPANALPGTRNRSHDQGTEQKIVVFSFFLPWFISSLISELADKTCFSVACLADGY